MYIEKVKEFHDLCEIETPDYITFTNKLKNKRNRLIFEELRELKDAINNNDIVETLDALCDLNYVLLGTLLECGFKSQDNFNFNNIPAGEFYISQVFEYDFIIKILETVENKLDYIKQIRLLLYSLNAIIIKYGFAPIYEKAFDLVHVSNMEKVIDGKIIKDKNGKIRKPDNWQKPNLKQLIEGDNE